MGLQVWACFNVHVYVYRVESGSFIMSLEREGGESIITPCVFDYIVMHIQSDWCVCFWSACETCCVLFAPSGRMCVGFC